MTRERLTEAAAAGDDGITLWALTDPPVPGTEIGRLRS